MSGLLVTLSLSLSLSVDVGWRQLSENMWFDWLAVVLFWFKELYSWSRFLAPTGERTDEGVPRCPRGPKKEIPTLSWDLLWWPILDSPPINLCDFLSKIFHFLFPPPFRVVATAPNVSRNVHLKWADCPAMSFEFVWWQIEIQMQISWVGRSTNKCDGRGFLVHRQNVTGHHFYH